MFTFRRVLLQTGRRPPADRMTNQVNDSTGDAGSEKQQHEVGETDVIQPTSRTQHGFHPRVIPVHVARNT